MTIKFNTRGMATAAPPAKKVAMYLARKYWLFFRLRETIWATIAGLTLRTIGPTVGQPGQKRQQHIKQGGSWDIHNRSLSNIYRKNLLEESDFVQTRFRLH